MESIVFSIPIGTSGMGLYEECTQKTLESCNLWVVSILDFTLVRVVEIDLCDYK